MYTFYCAGHPPSANNRLHWAKKARLMRVFKEDIAWQVKAVYREKPLALAHVRCIILHSTAHLYDYDNAYSVVKSLVDGLTMGGLIEDDSPRHITLSVHQERGTARGVRITVEPAPLGDVLAACANAEP